MASKTVTVDGTDVVVETDGESADAEVIDDATAAFEEAKEVLQGSEGWDVEREFPDESPPKIYGRMHDRGWSGFVIRSMADADFVVCKINVRDDPTRVKFEYRETLPRDES